MIHKMVYNIYNMLTWKKIACFSDMLKKKFASWVIFYHPPLPILKDIKQPLPRVKQAIHVSMLNFGAKELFFTFQYWYIENVIMHK